jgi:hypothetical protein
MAAGRSDLFLRAEVVKKVLIAIGLAVTVPISVMAMVWGIFVVSLLCYGVNAGYAQRVIDYNIAAQIKDMSKPLVSTAVMALIVGALAWVATLNAPLLLFAGVSAGIAVYIAMALLLRVEAVTQTPLELIGTLTGWFPSSRLT